MSCLTGTLNNLRMKRAQTLADIEYLRQMSIEDRMDDRFDAIEAKAFTESVDNEILENASDIIDQISTDESFRMEEVERILNSDTDMTFDEMIGVTE
jgi:hypothetical protein